jgi:hypothetical protein
MVNNTDLKLGVRQGYSPIFSKLYALRGIRILAARAAKLAARRSIGQLPNGKEPTFLKVGSRVLGSLIYCF